MPMRQLNPLDRIKLGLQSFGIQFPDMLFRSRIKQDRMTFLALDCCLRIVSLSHILFVLLTIINESPWAPQQMLSIRISNFDPARLPSDSGALAAMSFI